MADVNLVIMSGPVTQPPAISTQPDIDCSWPHFNEQHGGTSGMHEHEDGTLPYLHTSMVI